MTIAYARLEYHQQIFIEKQLSCIKNIQSIKNLVQHSISAIISNKNLKNNCLLTKSQYLNENFLHLTSNVARGKNHSPSVFDCIAFS